VVETEVALTAPVSDCFKAQWGLWNQAKETKLKLHVMRRNSLSILALSIFRNCNSKW
jgi:hypothetical protein